MCTARCIAAITTPIQTPHLRTDSAAQSPYTLNCYLSKPAVHSPKNSSYWHVQQPPQLITTIACL